jgi:hypothetical protein
VKSSLRTKSVRGILPGKGNPEFSRSELDNLACTPKKPLFEGWIANDETRI